MSTQLTMTRMPFRYAPPIEAETAKLAEQLRTELGAELTSDPQWLALQLLENQEDSGLLHALPRSLQQALDASRQRLVAELGEEPELSIADSRYRFVNSVAAQVVVQNGHASATMSDRVDRLVTHPWVGIPLFLMVMYLVFTLVQRVPAPYVDWIGGCFDGFGTAAATAVLAWMAAPSWLTSLVTDGIIAGVGGVLTFLPSLLIMYFVLGLLEESGYLARAAFVMDRFMRLIGLHGKSFVPLILGFGCNVPAIYATRTIENQSARKLTALLIPFMSCSARLPVYVIFSLAFFPRHGDLVIWSMYLLGVVVAAIVGLILSRVLFRGESAGILIMELPPYSLPSLADLLALTWQRSLNFVRKAGTLILGMSVVLWLLMHLPLGVTSPQESLFGRVSSAVAPVFAPAGFDDWSASGALIAGVVAKEVVISSLAQIHLGENAAIDAAIDAAGDTPFAPLAAATQAVIDLGHATVEAGRQLVDALTPGMTLFAAPTQATDSALTQALQGVFTPLSALAFLAFVVLYVPCAATIGAQSHEFGRAWAWLTVALTLIVPWCVAVLVFQGGRLLGFG